MSNKRKKTKFIIGILILFIIVIGILYYTKISTPKVSDPIKDSLAQCLTQKGFKMYGAYWCPHCKQQKELFGESFEYIDYVECTEDKAQCDKAGIEGYPTWIVNNQKYPGFKTLDQLKQLGGC